MGCAIWFTFMSAAGFLPITIYRLVAPEEVGGYVTPAVAVHGIVFTAWVLLYLAQTVLISRRNPRLHRRLGWIGAGVLVLVFYSGMHLVLGLWLDGETSQAQAAFNAVTFISGSALAAVGIGYRRQPFLHKRLMLCSTVILTEASTERALGMLEMVLGRQLPLGFYGEHVVYGMPLLALLLFDLRTYKRPAVALLTIAVFVVSSALYIHRPLLVHPPGEAVMRAIAPIFLP